MARTQHTLREILQRLHTIGVERPDDQSVIMDVMNIINHHVEIVDKLRKVSANEKPTRTVENLQAVLYDQS